MHVDTFTPQSPIVFKIDRPPPPNRGVEGKLWLVKILENHIKLRGYQFKENFKENVNIQCSGLELKKFLNRRVKTCTEILKNSQKSGQVLD